MKRSVLVVSPYIPYPPDFGGALRIFHFVRELSEHHDVILAAPAQPDDLPAVTALSEFCDVTAIPAHWTPRHEPRMSKRLTQLRSLLDERSFLERSTESAQVQAVIDRLFLTRRIDLVQFEFTQMGLFRLPRPCATVLDAHNIEHELLERVARGSQRLLVSRLKMAEAAKIQAFEQRIWRDMTLCVATSERDAETIGAATSRQVHVVPNGVDYDSFARPSSVPGDARSAVFTGVMRHQPNEDAVHWYVEQIHPRVLDACPDATFTIVGADPSPTVRDLKSSTINVTGRVEDTRPYLHRAAVAVVPLRSGGGTRLKILEAFAAGTPVVSTTLGAEGLEVQHGVHLLIADSPAEFAAAVVRTMTDSGLAATLSRNALELARAKYDWSVVGSQLVGAHDEAVSRFARERAARASAISHDTSR
jgi:polysaccharide biosynthesis protein PslH